MSSDSFEDIVRGNPDYSNKSISASEVTKAALLAVVHEKVRPPSRYGS